VLFDRRFGEGVLEFLYVEGDVDGLDPLQPVILRYFWCAGSRCFKELFKSGHEG
jgi:hypothetical protein